MRLGIPIVPVVIEGCGYDFDEARAFCEARPPNWGERGSEPGALAAVARRLTPPVSIDQASRLLATALATIPPIIAVSFDPAASNNHVAAVVRDINEKKERAVRHAGSAAVSSASNPPDRAAESSLRAEYATHSVLLDGLVRVSAAASDPRRAAPGMWPSCMCRRRSHGDSSCMQ